jgi:hypothetical protein
VVTSTDKVVGRASVGVTMDGRGWTIYVSGVGSSLRCVRSRLEGGVEVGVEVVDGGTADLEACSLGLTAAGMACSVSGPGTSAVLRACHVEGRNTVGGGRPLYAAQGASLALEEGCTLDGGVGGGTEQGVEVYTGATVELEACSLGLTAAGMACWSVGPGTSAKLPRRGLRDTWRVPAVRCPWRLPGS